MDELKIAIHAMWAALITGLAVSLDNPAWWTTALLVAVAMANAVAGCRMVSRSSQAAQPEDPQEDPA